jgi:hypothetical protein
MSGQWCITCRMGSDQHLHSKRSWKKGHGAKFFCPVTKLQHHLSAILYVDDTDLLHIDLTKDESVKDVHIAIQESVNSWGNLLTATEGVLQPQKCFYSIISFKWKNGEWKYAENNKNNKYSITVPLPGGGNAAIIHKSITHAGKTLGAMTSPDGNSSTSLGMMQDNAQQLINDVRGGHLHRHNVWFSMKVQLWPSVRYGICSSTATFQILEGDLRKQYYQLLPLRGIVHTTQSKAGRLTPASSALAYHTSELKLLLQCPTAIDALWV